jgi:AcrR family transcriptional regulator
MSKTDVIERTSDPRVLRTRRDFQDALVTLIDDDATITASALADRAGMSRQAFHSRYTSIAELAADTLYRRLLEGAGHVASLEPDRARHDLVDRIGDEGLEPFLTVVNADRLHFLRLRELALDATSSTLAEVFVRLVVRDHTDRTVPDTPQQAEAATFAAAGMTGLLHAWLISDDIPPVHDQANRLMRYARGVQAALRH